MFSIVVMAALVTAPEPVAFKGPWATPGWPYYIGQCKTKIYGSPYAYSGTYTLYAGYYGAFGTSVYSTPLVPGTLGILANQSGPSADFKAQVETPEIKPNPPQPQTKPVVVPEVSFQPQMSKNRAELIVEVPEGATLFVNGVQISAKSGKRSFVTPELATGKTHLYDLKWKIGTGSTARVGEKTIEVHAGKMQTVSLGAGNLVDIVFSQK